MSNYSVSGKSIGKSFGRRLIFENLDFEFLNYGVFGISGPNGSGKSTLVKIIAGLTSATKGRVVHKFNGKEVIPEKLFENIGFVSPYLVLYEEFSAVENLKFFSEIRKIEYPKEIIDNLLNRFLLFNRKDDLVKTYSSGMKQRLKFIFALMHSPSLLIFDEPTSNLDDEGKESVYKIIIEESKSKIVIVASNENTDLELCSSKILLEKYK
ncbi:MAG: ABC transporter ATP-binding protein [Ignavibacteriaceae bacterium]|nr:ABC transporter ATP-binding protein [Ignavibacteriaceae bacterium]